MRKVITLLLCLLLLLPRSFAADFEITDDDTVEVNKEALLAALYEADISSIREAIDLGLITCVELTEYYLERIEAYNDTFQCFITLCDNALQVAEERDAELASGKAEGKLFGIPIVVKDNIDYEGYPTTNGLWSYNNYPASRSATIVQYLLDEGAVILGKTNMSAAAQDALCSINASGLQTFNAYNQNLSSGGSSGGSASAVSLNFAVVGLGTDTNSSLRYPSALNGCVTLRTTFGLLDRDGCTILNYSRDTPGAITRSVMDQAIMLDVMSGGTYAYAENLDANALSEMRIGVLSELAYPIDGSYNRKDSDLDDEIQAAFHNAVEELIDCGAEVVVVSMPEIFTEIASANSDYNYSRERLYDKMEALMEEYSVKALIFPTYLHSPHYVTYEYLQGKSIFDQPYICNCATLSPLTGAPELTLPIGQHTRGAAIGMEIFSLKNQEQLLLNIAYSYSERYDHRQAPDTAPSLHHGDQELTLEEFLEQYRRSLVEAEALKYEEVNTEPPTQTQTTPEVTVTEPPEEVEGQASKSKDYKLSEIIWYLVPMILLISGCAAAFIISSLKERARALGHNDDS